MNACTTPGHSMAIEALLGALVVLCNTVSAYVIVKTRSRNGTAPR